MDKPGKNQGNGKIQHVRNFFGGIVLALSRLSMAACLLSALAVSIDVVLRKLSSARFSIPGSSELSSYLLIIMCMLSIPALQVKNGHVSIRLFLDLLPSGIRATWTGILYGFEGLISTLFTYASFKKFEDLYSSGTTSDVIGLAKWPFALVIMIGFLELTILLFLDSMISFRSPRQDADASSEAGQQR